MSNALNTIIQLKGVKYDLKKEFAYSDSLVKNEKLKEKLEKDRKNKIGFIAQDVQKVLPEVVVYNDSTDSYGVCYSRIVPVIVEAIKEQQILIDNLAGELNFIKDKKSQKSATLDEEEKESDQNILYQNSPNPFSENTQIKYVIADNFHDGQLNIYNMSGKQLKSFNINQSGKGTLTIEGSDYGAGLFLYTLIVNGKIVDTKQMVLTK